MICQLILVALAFNQANALSTCYSCTNSGTTESTSSGWSTALVNQVASRTGSTGNGNCADPGASAPNTVNCNGTSFCSKTLTQYTLSDADNDVGMASVVRGCLVPSGGNYASYEIEGCWTESDTDNRYISDALTIAALDVTNTVSNSSLTLEYDSINWCLCNDVDNCNAAGHTMAAAMLVAAMAILNFL